MEDQKYIKYSKSAKTAYYVLLDGLLLNFSMVAALFLQSEFRVDGLFLENLTHFVMTIPVYTILFYLCALLLGAYKILWEFSDFRESFVLFSSAFAAAALYGGCGFLLGMSFPLPVYFMAAAIDFILIILIRFSYWHLARRGMRTVQGACMPFSRILVVGAGNAGAGVIREHLRKGPSAGVPVVAVDDDPAKNRTRICGVPVVQGTDNIPALVEHYRISDIIIAIPSASPRVLAPITRACAETHCRVRTVPPMQDIVNGWATLNQFREINISDLLSRDEFVPDLESISDYVNDQVVLVTGGGGSIGSEICRQVARFGPKQLLIMDIYENEAYTLFFELSGRYGAALPIKIIVGSIQDEALLDDLFRTYRPDVVFHAAAHKHVPLMEENAAEAVKNNIFGTLNVALCADRYGASRFVLLSTDKAVNPTSIMGATKRVAELIMQYMAGCSSTRYMAVRFGNVLGSNGSVIPLFQKQIEAGGPVTITHPEISRYFMTIPEAVQLVLQAGSIAESGAVYVLDMGEPVKIIDLAYNLIRLSGYRPEIDIAIEYVGLRPGEKLHEELMLDEERDRLHTTLYKKILIAPPHAAGNRFLEYQLEKLRKEIERDPHNVAYYLKAIVPTFHPPGESVLGDPLAAGEE